MSLTKIKDLDNIIFGYKKELEIAEKYNICLKEIKNINYKICKIVNGTEYGLDMFLNRIDNLEIHKRNCSIKKSNENNIYIYQHDEVLKIINLDKDEDNTIIDGYKPLNEFIHIYDDNDSLNTNYKRIKMYVKDNYMIYDN